MSGSAIARGAVIILVATTAGCERSPSAPDPDVSPSCEPVLLDAGESAMVRGGDARLICVLAPPGGGEHIAVVTLGRTKPVELTVLREDIVSLSEGPFSESLRGAGAGRAFEVEDAATAETFDSEAASAHAPHHSGWSLHARVRKLERAQLTPRIDPAGVAPLGMRTGPRSATLTEGDVLTLNVSTELEQTCEDGTYRVGRVEAVSERAIVVSDPLNPDGGFGAEDFHGFAAAFDTLVAPLAEEHFGEPTDLDGNGRVILLFTREVNRHVDEMSGGFSPGFFFARDLFPRTPVPGGRLGACPHSNEAEVLYLLVPDPEGEIDGIVREREAVERIMLSVLIHEYQHLINAGRRLHGPQGREWPERVWLDEALSHMAEELLFYRASGLEPGGNIGFPALQAAGPQALEAFERHQRFNLVRFHQFLQAPGANSPFNPEAEDALATRGAAWSFLRYAADRVDGPEASFLGSLVESPITGFDNLASAVGGVETLQDWLGDWHTANLVDERIGGIAQHHRHASWNFPSLFEALRNLSPQPLPVVSINPGEEQVHRITGGGSAYLFFLLGFRGDEGSILEFTQSGANPPEALRVSIVRTR